MGLWDWLMGTPAEQAAPLPRRMGGAATPSARRTTVFGLRVNDVVTYDDVDYVVKNAITYEDDGFYWYDFLLVDDVSKAEIWVSAEDDDGVSIGVFREVQLPNVPPVPPAITVDGKRFTQTERGTATAKFEREDETRDTTNRVEFWDFDGPGGTYLSISRWGDDYEASVGREIQAWELKIFPAEG